MKWISKKEEAKSNVKPRINIEISTPLKTQYSEQSNITGSHQALYK